jgi:pyruvate dehydrogenase E2 component (dihydrolipoamide acetyltransferase)
MAISVVMPALEMAQETGKLLAWRKKEGEVVTKGEPLLEIETDKAVVEIEAPSDGILAGITSHEGAVVPVGETIAWIVAPGEKPPIASAPPTPTARTNQESAKSAAPSTPSAARASTSANITISPKARRLAKEHGIDIAQMTGTGPEGSITTDDVLKARGSSTDAPKTGAASPTPVAPSAIARLMAERTTKSWTTVPHFFLVRDADAGSLLDLHKKIKAKSQSSQSISPTLTDCLIALVAQVLERHPIMNATWANDTVRPNANINISLAMAVADGVVAPVIQNANKSQLAEIATQRTAATERARSNRLLPADLANGTFTISNLGMFKVDAFTAIITPPQSAVLAVAAISDRVVAVDGKPAVRPVLTLTLSSDHRLIDGARAAQFLNDVVEAIREPESRLPL